MPEYESDPPTMLSAVLLLIVSIPVLLMAGWIIWWLL